MNEKSTEIKKSIGKNFTYSFFITVIIGFVNILYPILIGLLYGPETIGNFSVLFYWSILLNIPISNGLAMGITRFIAANGKEDSIFFENLGARITFFYLLGVIIIYPIIGVTLFSLNAIEIIIVVILLINLSFHYLIRKSLQGQEKFHFLFKQELISFLVFIPIMVIFSILPHYIIWKKPIDTNYFLFLPLIFYHFLFNFLYIINRRKTITFENFFKFPAETKRILLYAFFIALGSFFSIGMSQIQIVVSNEYLNEIELGILSFWTAAIGIISIFTVSIGSLLLPRITNLKAVDEYISKKFVNSVNWSLVLILAPFSTAIFVLFATYPHILDFITLYKYNMIDYWLVAILLCYKEINLLLLEPTMTSIFSSENKIRTYPITSFFSTISIILLWIFLTPIYGIFGFAIGIAFGSVILVVLNLIYILIVTKKAIGSHIIIFLLNSLFGVGSILLLQIWHNYIFLIIWSIIALITLGYGINLLVKILRNKEFTVEYTLLKSDT